MIMTPDKIEKRIAFLQEAHHHLDDEIKNQYKNYANDSIVEELKKQKLKLKDKIEYLKNQLH